jgi:DNA-binding response OmpR family regulator
MSRGVVLVVDDHKDVVELVRYNLAREGYDVVSASSGEEGLVRAALRAPHVVLLDRSMPGLDGLEVCRRLRAKEATALVSIILLTGRATESDRVEGFEAGADDYMVKPFSPRELVARVRAVMRRAASRPVSQEVLQVGDLVIDAGRHQVTFRGKPVDLTAGEFRIVRFMAARPGRALSRQELIDGALGGSVDGLSRTVDVHLASIRRKLGRGAGVIDTVRGIGYRMAEGAAEPASRER